MSSHITTKEGRTIYLRYPVRYVRQFSYVAARKKKSVLIRKYQRRATVSHAALIAVRVTFTLLYAQFRTSQKN